MATKLITILFILFLNSTISFSQGNIDHIKNQEYMKYKEKVDCNNLPGDNLSARICANLAYQKSDSLLVVVCDSLLKLLKHNTIDSFENKISKMQLEWRKMRDEHCGMIYDSYEGSASSHIPAIAYLNCLKELTDNRIKELKKLCLLFSEE